MTVTWLSPASMGAVTAGLVWLPEPLPSCPLVVSPSSGAGGAVAVVELGGVAVADHGDLVARGVDRCGGAGVGLVARTGAVLTVGGVTVGAGRRCRRTRLQWWTRRVVLPSPMTVTWLPEASTGAVAPASVWLPAPVPSWPTGVVPGLGPSVSPAVAELDAVVARAGRGCCRHRSRSPGCPRRRPVRRRRRRSGCPNRCRRAVGVVPAGYAAGPGGRAAVAVRGWSRLVAVADHGDLVAGGRRPVRRRQRRSGCRAGPVLAVGGVSGCGTAGAGRCCRPRSGRSRRCCCRPRSR